MKEKKEKRRPVSTTTRIDVELVRKAKIVAIWRDMELFEYLDAILRPVVQGDYEHRLREEARRRPSGESGSA